MKATLNSYTHNPINIGDLVYANDIIELRNNTEKLLAAFNNHLGTINPADGGACESDNNKREHAIASASLAGFAPRNIDNQLEKARQEFSNLMLTLKSDCYPELTVAIWYGKKVKSRDLPKGWLFCDGKEVLYTDSLGLPVYTPDFTYTEIVAASTASGREVLSKAYAQKRECTGSTGSLANLGEGVSKWYIIKKPEETTPIPTISVTVYQPSNGVRIDTNYTSGGDVTYLKSLPDGHVETNNYVPENASLRFDTLISETHEVENLYVTHSTTGKAEVLMSPGRLTTTPGDNLSFTAKVKRREFTFTIKGTSNQTITVVCGGRTYTSSTSDVTFTAYGGESWSASVAGAAGYTPGSIIGPTSGTISGNVEVSASAAIRNSWSFRAKVRRWTDDDASYIGVPVDGDYWEVLYPKIDGYSIYSMITGGGTGYTEVSIGTRYEGSPSWGSITLTVNGNTFTSYSKHPLGYGYLLPRGVFDSCTIGNWYTFTISHT